MMQLAKPPRVSALFANTLIQSRRPINISILGLKCKMEGRCSIKTKHPLVLARRKYGNSISASKEHLNPGIEMYNGHRFPLVRKYGDPVTPSSEHCNPRMEMHNGGFVFPYKHFLHRLPLVRKYGNLGTPSKTHFSLRI